MAYYSYAPHYTILYKTPLKLQVFTKSNSESISDSIIKFKRQVDGVFKICT